MSAPTGVVLVASAVVASPLLWMVHQQTIAPQDALLRWLICVGICRVAISVVAALAYPSVRPVTRLGPDAAGPGTGAANNPQAAPAEQTGSLAG